MIPLDPSPNLIDQVYARILEAITDRTLLPGQRIRQNELAEKLGLRARTLPPHLASQARSDAQWARDAGPHLGLLDRRAYVVLPAEEMAPDQMLGRLFDDFDLSRKGCREH